MLIEDSSRKNQVLILSIRSNRFSSLQLLMPSAVGSFPLRMQQMFPSASFSSNSMTPVGFSRLVGFLIKAFPLLRG